MNMLAHMGQTGVKGHFGPLVSFSPFYMTEACLNFLLKKEHYCLIKVALLLLLLFDCLLSSLISEPEMALKHDHTIWCFFFC